MRNNEKKIEKKLWIIIVLILCMILGFIFFKSLSKIKLQIMKKDAIYFSRVVSMNLSTFHSSENVYLGEVIDEKLIKRIKNPLGEGYCSSSESSVEVVDNKYYVTLKCGEFLIEKVDFSEEKDVTIYSLSDWKDIKTEESNENQVLYNCQKDGKEVFKEYYESPYFIYQINKKYNTDYYNLDSVKDTCEVVWKNYYRTKEKIDS